MFLKNRKLQIAFVLFLILGSFFYWKIDFSFYFMDEWDLIDEYINKGLVGIFIPNNEHLNFVYKFLFFLNLKVFGLNVMYFRYLILLTHALNAVFFAYLIYILLKNNWLALWGGIFFLFHPLHFESMLYQGGTSVTLVVAATLLSLILLDKFISSRNYKLYYLALLCALVQPYLLGVGLILPVVSMTFIVLSKDKARWRLCIPFLIVFLCNGLIYKLLVPGKEISFDLIAIIRYYLTAILYHPARSLLLIDRPGFWLSTIFFSMFLGLSIYFFLRGNSQKRKVILLSWIYFLLSFVLMALTRFEIGPFQSFSYRYSYYYLIPLILLGLLFIKEILKLSKINFYPFLSLLIIPFTIICFLRVGSIKTAQTQLYLSSYREILKFKEDPNYQADLSKLNPTRDPQEILRNFIYLSEHSLVPYKKTWR